MTVATAGAAGVPGAAGTAGAAGTVAAAGTGGTTVGASGAAGTTAGGAAGATGGGGSGGGFVVIVGGAGSGGAAQGGGGAGGAAQGGGGAGGGGAGGAAQGGGGAGGAAQGSPCTLGRIATAMPEHPMTGDANADGAVASMAIDGNAASRWASGQTQIGGEWIAVKFTASVTLTGLVIDATASPTDYPREYEVEYSTDGTTFMAVPGATGVGMATTTVTFGAPVDALAIRINQIGMVEAPATSWWAVHEITFSGCMPAN